MRASQHLFSQLSHETRSARAQHGAQFGIWPQGTPHVLVSRRVVLANAPVTRPLAELWSTVCLVGSIASYSPGAGVALV